MLDLARTVSRVESYMGTAFCPQMRPPRHAGGSGFGPTGDSAIAAEKQIHRLVAEPVRENILELDASRFENSLFGVCSHEK